MVRAGRIEVAPESVPGAIPDRVLLVAALQKLSRPTRETIVLHHLADMSVHEVAETLGVPVGTVKARLSRGRALLADLIGDREGRGDVGRGTRGRAAHDRHRRTRPRSGEVVTVRPEDGRCLTSNFGDLRRAVESDTNMPEFREVRRRAQRHKRWRRAGQRPRGCSAF